MYCVIFVGQMVYCLMPNGHSLLVDDPYTHQLGPKLYYSYFGTFTTMSSNSPLYVQPGACFNGFAFDRCALESTECLNDSYDFYAASDIENSAGNEQLKAAACTTPDVTVARCTHNHKCASDREVCLGGHEFRLNTTCTVQSDTVSGEFTEYGRCRKHVDHAGINGGETDLCVWRKTDCDEDTTWEVDRWCDCTKVLTGACIGPDKDLYCAVSKKACSAHEEFLSVLDLQIENLDCRLCEPNDIELPNLGTPQLPGLSSDRNANSWLISGVVLCTLGVAVFVGVRVYQKKQIGKPTQLLPPRNDLIGSSVPSTGAENYVT